MKNPLSNLVLDYWYKVIMATGFAVFLFSGMGLLCAYPVGPTAAISLGAFFIGLGEWINHPLRTGLRAGDAFFPSAVITSHPRSANCLGCCFDLGGFTLVLFGLIKLL